MSDPVEKLKEKVVNLEQDHSLTRHVVDALHGRFDKHEERVISALESGAKKMTGMQIEHAETRTAFTTFCRWFKATMLAVITILVGLLGAAVTILVAMGVFS